MFFFAPTSTNLLTTQLVRDDYQIQVVLVAFCLIVFGPHMHILFKYKSEDSCAYYLVI